MPRPQKGFTLLDHPADLGIEAYGNTLAEAFEQAALGLISIIVDVSKIEPRHSRIISIQGVDVEHLLVRWLEEILYLYDGEHFVGGCIHVSQVGSSRLQAVVHGEPFDPIRHETRMDVKAVTYHQLEVHQEQEKSWVRVFLDI